MFNKVSGLWIICIAAIMISLLANLNLISQIYVLAQEEALSLIKKEEMHFILSISRKNIISDFIIILSIGLFNYRWNEFRPLHTSTPKRLILFLFANLLLLFALIYTDHFLEENLTPVNSGFQFSNFLFNHLSVLILAYLIPFLLIRIRNSNIAEQKLITLKEEKAKAELAVLKEQISPHFFFNSLSTLSTIVRNEKKEKGLTFIQELSDTYRYTLRSSKADLVPLAEEVNFIRSYIHLLEKRYGEKLSFQLEIEAAKMKHVIPPMSLQLLIENAIQHNIVTKHRPLHIRVYIEDNKLCVSNKLQRKSEIESFGIGLSNLRNRYLLLSGKEIIIDEIEDSFTVKIPLL